MLASEVAEQIKVLLEKHGDCEVWIYNYQCSGHYNCEPFTGTDEVLYDKGRGRIRIEGE